VTIVRYNILAYKESQVGFCMALNCTQADIRVSGGWVVGGRWCKPIIVSNPTFVELS